MLGKDGIYNPSLITSPIFASPDQLNFISVKLVQTVCKEMLLAVPDNKFLILVIKQKIEFIKNLLLPR
jgi:hypothetical protein